MLWYWWIIIGVAGLIAAVGGAVLKMSRLRERAWSEACDKYNEEDQ